MIDSTIKELRRMFVFFNNYFYDGLLEEPVILIQTNGKHKNTLGWCTSEKIWTDKEKKTRYYEITICSEYLTREIEKIVGTLLHEMVHLHNLQYEIKDTSRSGSYHNKKFKKIAEEKGLIISYSKKIGWSLTELHPSTRLLIEDLKPQKNLFKISRHSHFFDEDGKDDPDENKSKSSTRKYICPKCGNIIRATKDVKVICGDCNIEFKLQ